jgi:IclR family transcriptional regulator, mhp operon transcriptional activator
MESTRPIRALLRGLDALAVLNLRDGATVSEVAQEIRLPRTTVYRILETLCGTGFVFRDPADDRYRLTLQVRGLSQGFHDDAWVTESAKPLIHELCREIVWPVSVATLSGTAMMLRETTDHVTPLAMERYVAGFRMPLLVSAAGRTYLACCAAAERDSLIEQLARSNKEENKAARGPRQELQRQLADIRARGYATTTRARRLAEEVSVSVPVMVHEHVLAVLTLRFVASAVPPQVAVERYLPRLRQCAARIGHSMLEQQAEGLIKAAPEAAA